MQPQKKARVGLRWCVTGRSKSLKFVLIESPLCDFILVFHFTYVPVFYRPIAIYQPKVWVLSPFPHHSFVCRPRSACCPGTLSYESSSKKLESLKTAGNCRIIPSSVLSQHQAACDGRTDGHAAYH